MNQINHPNILFSYGLIYPENYKKVDLKQLEKYLPKRTKKQLMSSVDKLMKKNKYGERQFPRFEKNRSPIMKHYGDINKVLGGTKKSRVKMSISPHPLRKGVRKKFNFSKTFKDFELGKDSAFEKDVPEEENDKDDLNTQKYVSQPKGVLYKQKNPRSKPSTNSKFRVKLNRNQKLKSRQMKNQYPKHLVMDHI